MRITPRGSPAFPATEDILAQTPATGPQPDAHLRARAPPATCAVPSALQTPAAGLGNARDWPLTFLCLPDPPLPRKSSTGGLVNAGGGAGTSRSLLCTLPPPTLAQPPPAIPTPAATHQSPSPPDTPAAGPVNAGGGARTSRSLPCTPPPPTHAQPPPAIPPQAAPH